MSKKHKKIKMSDDGPHAPMMKLKAELPYGIYEDLEAFAKEKGWTMDDTVTHCIREHIDRQRMIDAGWIRVVRVEEHRGGGL